MLHRLLESDHKKQLNALLVITTSDAISGPRPNSESDVLCRTVFDVNPKSTRSVFRYKHSDNRSGEGIARAKTPYLKRSIFWYTLPYAFVGMARSNEATGLEFQCDVRLAITNLIYSVVNIKKYWPRHLFS